MADRHQLPWRPHSYVEAINQPRTPVAAAARLDLRDAAHRLNIPPLLYCDRFISKCSQSYVILQPTLVLVVFHFFADNSLRNGLQCVEGR